MEVCGFGLGMWPMCVRGIELVRVVMPTHVSCSDTGGVVLNDWAMKQEDPSEVGAT